MSLLFDVIHKVGGPLGRSLSASQMKSGKCLTHGVSFSAVTFEGQLPVCPHCAKEQIKAFDKAAIEKNQSRENIGEEELRRLGIPPLFFNASLDTYEVTTEADAKLKKMAEKISKQLLDRRSEAIPATHLLFGSTGVGKTHIGCALVRWAYMHHFSAHYGDIRTLYGLMTDIQRTEGYSASRRIFSGPDLLVVDEVGTQTHEKIAGFLQELLEVRYADAKITILVGNFQPETLEAMIGERCIDRVSAKSSSFICHVNGISRR